MNDLSTYCAYKNNTLQWYEYLKPSKRMTCQLTVPTKTTKKQWHKELWLNGEMIFQHAILHKQYTTEV